jgi:hypothetical protein
LPRALSVPKFSRYHTVGASEWPGGRDLLIEADLQVLEQAASSKLLWLLESYPKLTQARQSRNLDVLDARHRSCPSLLRDVDQ